MNLISVILPTYNERDNIAPLIRAVHRALDSRPHEIIVVDDQSPDQTYRRVCELNDPQVKAILRKSDPGLGASIRCGIESSRGELLVVMDSDFDHNPDYIPFMVKMAADYDCVCASRFLYGGKMNGLFRAGASWLFNLFVRLLTWSPLTDHLYGYFCIKREVLERCPYDKIFYGHGDYYIRMLYFLQKTRSSILQFPAINGGRVRPNPLGLMRIFRQYLGSVLRLSQTLESHV